MAVIISYIDLAWSRGGLDQTEERLYPWVWGDDEYKVYAESEYTRRAIGYHWVCLTNKEAWPILKSRLACRIKRGECLMRGPV